MKVEKITTIKLIFSETFNVILPSDKEINAVSALAYFVHSNFLYHKKSECDLHNQDPNTYINKISLIKLLRSITSLSLKESKYIVEAILDRELTESDLD